MNHKNQKYKATELYAYNQNKFICPHCSNELYFQILNKENGLIFGQCNECKNRISVELPKLRKKLIYLDQWFVSNLFDDKKKEQFEGLIEKIKNLIALQKITIIVSDIHAGETANIPISEKQALIWEKFNSLANGRITKDGQDILVNQIQRTLRGEKETFPWSDILNDDPHDWIVGQYIGSGIHAQILLTNSWRLRLHKMLTPDSEQINQQLMDILHKQCESISPTSSESECFDYIKSLWLLDLKDSVKYYQAMNKLSKGEAIDDVSFLTKNAPPFYQIIKLILDEYNDSSKEKYITYIFNLFNDSNLLPKYIHISIALEAQRLFSALQALKNDGGITKNKKKFSRKYGVSSNNDASHISSFIPYVDILITDDNARKLLSKSIIEEYLSNLAVNIYSNNNIDLFDKSLDQLVEEEQDECISITLELIHSMSKYQQKLLFEEILLEAITRLKKSND